MGATVAVLAVLAVGLLALEELGSPSADPGTGGAGTVVRSTADDPGAGSRSAGDAGTVTATASCRHADSRDAAGTPTGYSPDRAVDSDLSTAWRCAGDGEGQSITLRLGRAAPLTRLGIVPGLAKTDPFDGTDRYAQNRRIDRVRVDVAGAPGVEATLDPAPDDRSVQEIALAGAVTDTVTVTILSSVPGTAQGDRPATDTVAVSEIVLR